VYVETSPEYENGEASENAAFLADFADDFLAIFNH